MKQCLEERFLNIVPEAMALFEAHHKEVSGIGELDMNWTAYRQLERSGNFLCVTLRENGKLIGYWTVVIAPLLHSKSLRTAMTDLVYIVPKARSHSTFSLIFNMMQNKLLARGVSLWFVGEKVKKSIGPLLERKGFSLEERVFLKRLGEV